MNRIKSVLPALLMTLCANLQAAESYPTKPIRLVTAEVGGGSDFGARILAAGLSPLLGRQVIVDNRGNAAAEVTVRAPNDGYTLLFWGTNVWVQPLLRKHPAYDPVRDLSPITMAVHSPNVLVVQASFPANSVQELIDYAKARPGVLNYGSPGTGASGHLGAELFNARAGVKTVRIAYRGTGPATNALVSGEVQMMFGTASSVAPHIKSGRLKALAVSSAKPTALAPGLPTVAVTLPGYESTAMWGVFAPAKTPPALIDWLNKKVVEVLRTPDATQKFFSSGAEVIASSPEWCLAKIKSEVAIMGKLIKDAGIGEE